MKNIFLKFSGVAMLLVFCEMEAQIATNANTVPSVTNSNLFLDASSFEGLPNLSTGRGLGFPRTDLTAFVFDTTVIDEIAILSDFDGMVVYNITAGTTVSGQGVVTDVVPGFYYFYNPGNPGNITGGVWKQLGGSSTAVKSKTVTGVVADGVAATLDLGTAVIAANEVVELVGAKVYNAAGDLVIGAFSNYTKATNILATGNGMMYQVLPAGTYKVVVDYK